MLDANVFNGTDIFHDASSLFSFIFYFLSMQQAAVSALQNQPVINAVIDGDDIIYRDYIDISIAVGTSKVWQAAFPVPSLCWVKCMCITTMFRNRGLVLQIC